MGIDFPNPPWIPTVTCEQVTNVVLTAEALDRRIKKLLTIEYNDKEEAEGAMNDVLVRIRSPKLGFIMLT